MPSNILVLYIGPCWRTQLAEILRDNLVLFFLMECFKPNKEPLIFFVSVPERISSFSWYWQRSGHFVLFSHIYPWVFFFFFHWVLELKSVQDYFILNWIHWDFPQSFKSTSTCKGTTGYNHIVRVRKCNMKKRIALEPFRSYHDSRIKYQLSHSIKFTLTRNIFVTASFSFFLVSTPFILPWSLVRYIIFFHHLEEKLFI